MSIRVSLVAVFILFVVGLVLGLSMPSESSGALPAETDALGQLVEFIGGLPPLLMFVFILLKNISVVLLCFVTSPFFLILPILSLVMNGWIIGSVSSTIVADRSLGYLLAGIMPHGVFELPALFIGVAAAMSFGLAAMRAVFHSSARSQLVPALKTNLKYLGISVVLFLPAALLETFVTPILLRRFS